LSPDLANTIRLNIQIKQKTGIDPEDKIGVEQLTRMSSGAPNEYNILISTADDFTQECKKLAKEGNVTLIKGEQFAKIIMKHRQDE
jgi:hypothetical protein